MSKIRFGTDGWRGVIADTFTFDNVRIIAQALADYIQSIGQSSKPIAIGYDYRFMSETYAKIIADTLSANKIHVLLSNQALPTPALSFAVKNQACSGGIMITASHNPPEYNGVKFKGDYGGSAITSIIRDVEKYLYKSPPKLQSNLDSNNIIIQDFIEPYIAQICSLVDMKLLNKSKFRIVSDSMHGSGKNYLQKILSNTACEVISIRTNRDCLFGGILPEPIPKNLQFLMDKVRETKADIGLATDGDADRLGIIDSTGEYIWPHFSIPILFEHLRKNRNWTGHAVRTVSLASILDKVVSDYPGSKVFEVPIGFKNICEYMLKEDILIGGEESGGIGLKNHIPERDGLLISLLLLEYLSVSGKKLNELVMDMEQRYGKFFYDRIDTHLEDEKRAGLIERLRNKPPDKIANIPVSRLESLDGLKFILSDNSWVLIRASDTEPVVRLYSGSNTMEKVQKLLLTAKLLCGITKS